MDFIKQLKLYDPKASDPQKLASLVLLETTEDLRWFRWRLARRVEEGINNSFLLQIKLLHAFTGHLLSKFGAL